MKSTISASHVMEYTTNDNLLTATQLASCTDNALVATYALSCLYIPVSNAVAERVFSHVTSVFKM